LFFKAHYKREFATYAALRDADPELPCQARACLSLALGRPGKEFGPPCCKHHEKIWELKGDWNKGFNLADLYKPTEGRQWTPVLNNAGMVPLPPAAQRIGT